MCTTRMEDGIDQTDRRIMRGWRGDRSGARKEVNHGGRSERRPTPDIITTDHPTSVHPSASQPVESPTGTSRHSYLLPKDPANRFHNTMDSSSDPRSYRCQNSFSVPLAYFSLFPRPAPSLSRSRLDFDPFSSRRPDTK